MSKLTSAELENLIKSKQDIIVQFGDERCLPCKDIKSKVKEWSMIRDDIDYIYIDRVSAPEIAASYGIFVVPAILVFIQGKLTLQKSGYFSLEDILTKTEQYLVMLK